ncbi:MAG: hypothetical protein QXX81_02370 [Zestosphaera sp.]
MVAGSMVVCTSGIYEGVPYRLTYTSLGAIGGYGKPRCAQLNLPVDTALSPSFLSILLKGEDLRPKSFSWKVSVNTINVTREFKPQILVESEGLTYASQTFDVTQIVREPGKYTLRLSAETSRVVEILSVSLVGLTPVPGVRVNMSYYSGVLTLSNGESYSFKHPAEGLELGFESVVEVPSKTAELAVGCGGERVFIQLVGLNELVLKKTPASPDGCCRLSLRRSDSTRPLVVGDVLIYRSLTPSPHIHTEASMVDGKEVLLQIRNGGGPLVGKVVVVVLCEGRVVAKSEVSDLRSGHVEELRLRTSEDLSGKEAYIRVIYNDVWGQDMKTLKLRTV